jgi:hypothetical protein
VPIHVDAATQRHDTLAGEPRALRAMRGGARRERDAAAGRDDAVPGHRAARWQPGQHLANQPRAARHPGAVGDQTVGAHLSTRDTTHDLEDRVGGIDLLLVYGGSPDHASEC